MKINAFIAVRLGSTRIPFKNFVILNKKPIYEHLTDTILDSKIFKNLFLNTDSQIVIEIAKKKYKEKLKYYLRPNELGTSDATLDEYTYDFMKKNPSDITVFLNPCSIFLSSNSIKNALKVFESKKLDSCVASAELKTHCFFDDTSINFNMVEKQPRSQDLKSVHAMTSGFFIWRNTTFIKNFEEKGYANFCGKFFSYGLPDIEAIDIDELEDLKLASKILEQRKLTKLSYHPLIKKLIEQKKIHVN